LVLLDLMMPHMDGFAIMEQLATKSAPGDYVPIVVFSADASAEARRKAWALGARDFFVKPFDASEFMLRILNLLETRYLHLRLKNQNEALEQRVQERTAKLRASQIEILKRLGQAAEYRDDDTGQHTERVGEIAARIAGALKMAPEQVEIIRRAAPLHDVGKIGIPEKILLKPGGLSPEEFEVMKTHTSIGAGLLSGGGSEFLQAAERIALSHHERWDGSGYPHRLAGEAIPLEARLVAIADVYDAISHDRPYKKASSPADALAIIEGGAGTQFDPKAVAAFVQSQSADIPEV
jgi:putative two-component system response regulator